MYIKKLEYFRTLYKEKYLLSGFLIKQMGHLPIGTPCMVSLDPNNTKFKMPTIDQLYKPPPWGGFKERPHTPLAANTGRLTSSRPSSVQSQPARPARQGGSPRQEPEDGLIHTSIPDERLSPSERILNERIYYRTDSPVGDENHLPEDSNIEVEEDMIEQERQNIAINTYQERQDIAVNEEEIHDDRIETGNTVRMGIPVIGDAENNESYCIDTSNPLRSIFEEDIIIKKGKAFHINTKTKKNKRNPKPTQKENRELTTADIITSNRISEINKNLHEQVKMFRAIILFNIVTGPQADNFTTINISPLDFCYSKQKPIIYDNGLYLELKDFKEDIATKEGFPPYIESLLETNRFINYTISDIGKSNIKSIKLDIELVIGLLMKAYKYHINLHRHIEKVVLPLLDVISISFYKVEDVIAIFDYKKLNGVCMEISFTNSDRGIDINKPGNMATYRFLFSKYRDNLFIIDGELIQRQYDMPTADGMQEMCKMASGNVPDDTILYK